MATVKKITATLVAITATPVVSRYRDSEETYEYKIDDQNVKFHAHPTKAWQWVIVSGDVKLVSKVIKAACAVGFQPEKLKTLKVPA